MREFVFSGKFIRSRRQSFFIIFCFMAVALFCFALYISNFRIKESLLATGMTLLMCVFFVAVEMPLSTDIPTGLTKAISALMLLK